MISAVILAAGKSTRMGQMKLLLPIADKSMIRMVIENTLASKADEVIIVLGNEAVGVRSESDSFASESKAAKTKLKLVENPRFAEGQSTSLRAGLSMVNKQCMGALFLMGDQPFVRAMIIDRIITCFLKTNPLLVVPEYPEGQGAPILFARDLFPELIAVTGDKGGRDVVRKYMEPEYRRQVSIVKVQSGLAGQDIDTWEEFQKLSVQKME